jgi:hypothetical protein
MISYYCIVRYVPNPLIEEFVNVGVVTFGEGRVCVRFVRSLRRAEQFAGQDAGFVRDIERWMKTATEEDVRKASVEWENSIQLSSPRGSTLDPEKLLEEIAKEFLREASSETK